jgi:CubicO group peptidase (beta-lactamase class C family)
MRFTPRFRRWLVALTLLAVLSFAAFLWLRPLLNIGAGYAAKHACSCHFLQGRELEEIRRNDLNFSVLGYVSLSKEGKTIHSSFFGLVPREARFREGVGCTLVNDPKVPFTKVVGADAGAKNVGIAMVAGPAALQPALDFAMAPLPGGGARGLVVLHKGEVIAERYAPGYDQNSLLLGWSMSKTLTAMALGTALQPPSAPAAAPSEYVSRKGLLPEIWTDSVRQLITIADLLHMNSGLLWNEAYGGLSDATIMLHEHSDMARYAYYAPAVATNGENWMYSSGTTNILVELIEQNTPLETAHEFMHKLYAPVAPSLLLEPDQAGRPVGSSYGWATARDWANLGQFMLQDGVWNGDTLLPPGWIDWMRTPAKGSEGIYGGQTWLPGPDMPDLPKDAFLMRGFQDQRVIIIPSHQLVIARLGHEDDKTADFNELVKQLLVTGKTIWAEE